MADNLLIKQLGKGAFDSTSLIPVMTSDSGVLKTIQVTSDNIADYALSKVESKTNGLTFEKNTETGKWELSHTVDTTLYVVVSELPTENIDSNKIYVMPATDKDEEGNPQNIYAELIYVNDKWELIGKHKADTDLSDYAKTVDVEKGIKDLRNDVFGYTDEDDQSHDGLEQILTAKVEANETAIDTKVNALRKEILGEGEGEDHVDGALDTVNKDLKSDIKDINDALDALVGEGTGSISEQIDAKVNALDEKILGNDKEGDDAIVGKLNEVKAELKALIDALDAKLKEYDERFGYTHNETDGTVWKKAFLMIADETQS